MATDPLSSDLASLRIDRDENPAIARGRRQLAVGAALAVVVVAGGAFALRSLSTTYSKVEVAVTEVRLVSPAQGSVEVTSTGYVVPQVASKVGAKLLGRVAEVRVEEGSRVEAGQVLVRLDDAEQRSAISAAKAREEAAKATLAETNGQFERERALAEQGASARSVAEDLGSRVDSLAAAAKAAEAERIEKEVVLRYATIVAPIDGVVVAKPAEVGELVGPGTGPVVELADFSSLLVETDVPEGKLHRIRPGAPAEIVLDAYPARRYRGEVTEIGPRVNRAKATAIAKVKFVDPAEGVLPEMAARVGFLANALAADSMKEPPKLVVPASAVVDRAGAKVVFRIDDGKARIVPVTLGSAVGSGFELKSGPREGTRLVSSPPPSLADGQSIKEKSP